MKDEWKPNLFIPGFPKCGTTALANYLKQHKDVYVIEGKEPCTLYHWKKVARFMIPNPEKPHIGKPVSFEAYKKAYEENKEKRYRVDASQPYSFDPEFLKELKKFNPEAKIILMIRDQIKRVYSAYNFTYPFHKKRFEDWFKEAIENELEMFLFTPYIKEAIKVFGKENVLIIEQNELKNNPQKVMNKVFEWLGIEKIKLKELKSNVSAFSVEEDEKTKKMKSFVMKLSSLIVSPVKFVVYKTGFNNTRLFLKIREHHPIIYVQRFLGKIKGRKGKKPRIPEKIEKILKEDYEKAKRYTTKI